MANKLSKELSFIGHMSGNGECFGFSGVEDHVLQLINGVDYNDPDVGLGHLICPGVVFSTLLGDRNHNKPYRFTLKIEEID